MPLSEQIRKVLVEMFRHKETVKIVVLCACYASAAYTVWRIVDWVMDHWHILLALQLLAVLGAIILWKHKILPLKMGLLATQVSLHGSMLLWYGQTEKVEEALTMPCVDTQTVVDVENGAMGYVNFVFGSIIAVVGSMTAFVGRFRL